MDEFILKFQSFEGIADILHTMDVEDILSKVSALSGISKESLRMLKIKDLGTEGRRSDYVSGIKELKKTIPFFSELYKAVSDDRSKKIMTAMFKYWLIPDEAFLRESYSGSPEEEKDCALIIKDPGEIKEHIEEIRALKSGETIKCETGDALK